MGVEQSVLPLYAGLEEEQRARASTPMPPRWRPLSGSCAVLAAAATLSCFRVIASRDEAWCRCK